MRIVRGDALLVPDNFNDPNSKKHLRVVVGNVVPPHGEVLLASIASYDENAGHDSTCLLHPGDHPFIRHVSYINYRFAEVMLVAKLLKHMQPKPGDPNQTNRIALKPTTVHYSHVSEDVLKRIHDGFYKTKRVGNFVFYYLEHPTNRR